MSRPVHAVPDPGEGLLGGEAVGAPAAASAECGEAGNGESVVEFVVKLPAQGCGLWAWIPPLNPGEHELLVKGESGTFSSSARYLLLVNSSD